MQPSFILFDEAEVKFIRAPLQQTFHYSIRGINKRTTGFAAAQHRMQSDRKAAKHYKGERQIVGQAGRQAERKEGTQPSSQTCRLPGRRTVRQKSRLTKR